jgi:starch-binding outer membrane protein, SusD/RagB family
MKLIEANILACNFSKLFRGVIVLFIIMIFVSCDEDEWLRTKPLAFYAPETSFINRADFEAGIYQLYTNFRDDFYSRDGDFQSPRVMLQGTDLVYYNSPPEFPIWSEILVPYQSFVYDAVWGPAYRLIYDANVLIGRSDSDISELTEAEKILVQAEARFFRGNTYKMLANLYGGVPLVLEETTEPKRDFVRSSRKETYEQAVSDLKFAAENLPDIDAVAGERISNLVAYHVLAEVYVSLEQWGEAINAASVVIDHPSTALMTERFGRRVDDEPLEQMPWAFGGDVYWDLFRKGNLARSSGNKEALWVLPYEYNVPGGGIRFTGGGIEWERFISPRIWQATVRNNDGSSTRVTPTPNTYYGGRSGGFMRLSEYFYHELWEKSGYDQDIRNAEHNIIRDFKVNNPASDHDGKWLLKDNLPIRLTSFVDTVRNFYPLIAKTASLGDHPPEVFIEDQTVPGSLTGATGPSFITHRDEYHIRLAETYLLRAEAYLGNNDLINAAEDINVVRRRSEAPEISASDVDIDYILDERLRELYIEEFRLLTLTRLGKLAARAAKYNPVHGTYAEHNNLWPIPASEIEKNVMAPLEQNPGYN